ncbi:MAG: T9SS C-terminal target domain-containing protein [Candidatus Zixiibacteriota bacterium]|nr:MAG: T9SS C-terminal target domain-containing protein [candidate division Zixibacteria bacterium]
MKRTLGPALLAAALILPLAFAADPPPALNPVTGAYGPATYGELDNLGDIITTIPAPPLGSPNNGYTGCTWANGELVVIKNIMSPLSSHFLRLDPATGAVLADVPFPFVGTALGMTFDGVNLWVVRFYPAHAIFCISLSGSEISSFLPATGSYTCRSIAWDGQYLWVGAGGTLVNDSRLYKMTTTGAILGQWDTDSTVGLYMDAEWNPDAPAGSQLFVMDNIGNTIKQLTVSGTSVTVAAQAGSPTTWPDFGEGVGFDGEYLWHTSVQASAGVFWCLDDGYATPAPEISITLTPENPPIIIPPGGGSFNFTAALLNSGTAAMTFEAWIMVHLPAGGWYGPVLGPLNLTLPGGANISRLRVQNVPGGTPAGSYIYEGRVGVYPDTLWDYDSFTFTKSAAEGPGNTEWGDWACTGDPFPGERGSQTPLLPSGLTLKASPNPFNPTTALSYELRAASRVTLRVYNTAGREVAALVDGWREAGSHEVTFDAAALASGIYFARLDAEGQSSVQKLVLLK